LSAGRVQSVATRLICDREEEIEKFVPEEYWTITAKLLKGGVKAPFEAKFYGLDNKKTELKSEEEVNKVLDEIKDAVFVVQKVKKGEKKKNPNAPFTTSTMQQEASRKLGFSTKKTMMVAQQLYEGIEVKVSGLWVLSLIFVPIPREFPRRRKIKLQSILKKSLVKVIFPKKKMFIKTNLPLRMPMSV